MTLEQEREAALMGHVAKLRRWLQHIHDTTHDERTKGQAAAALGETLRIAGHHESFVQQEI